MIGNELLLYDLLNKFNNNKLHHSILFIGKQGIGKATFVNELVYNIIKNNDKSVDSTQQLQMMQTYSHPDIFHFGNRSGETEKMTIDSTRECIDFVGTMPSILPAKFVIIDSINEMNNASCNALLKNLEEPRKNAYFFIICHNMTNIIQTIISRCFRIQIQEPSLEQTINIIANKTSDISLKNITEYALLSDNSIGNAIDLIGINGLSLYKQTLLDIQNKTALSGGVISKINGNNIEKILQIFINRIYKLLLSVNFGGQDIEILENETEFIESLKKSNNIQNIIYNFSNILKIINDIKLLNNSNIQSWHNILFLLRLDG